MITFNVTGFLTDFTDGRHQIPIGVSPAQVGEALDELWKLHPGLRDRVLNERGELRQHVNIFLDDENVRRKQLLDTALPENCEITILPSVTGGRETVNSE
ncbi:MAG: MoaD/ThiS family protein [Acidobacteriota bacterium]|nr:MoaD/ThiS family protein [Acidobacteriota bacterium]